MNVVICGAGQVGSHLARYLGAHNYNVTIIDQDQKLINNVNEQSEARAICGFASDPAILQAAGLDQVDMIIAVTRSDEINMVACELANALFKVPRRIARIRNTMYLNPSMGNIFSQSQLSINYVISPEIEVAHAIANGLTIYGAFNVIKFADGHFYLIGVRATAQTPIVNTPIVHIASLFPNIDFTILAIRREEYKFIPTERDIIMAGDEIYYLVPAHILKESLAVFGFQGDRAKKVVILGGGNIGLCLASTLELDNEVTSITVVEAKSAQAQFIAQSLKRSVVIYGDALESEILLEAGVKSADTVIAVTEDDKINTLATLFAKRLGARRVIALTNTSRFDPLVLSLGIDAMISPHVITVSKILQYIRQENMQQVYSLGNNYGEVIEIDAINSNLIGLTIEEINKPHDLIIAGILREQESIIPNRKTIIKAEDRIILMVSSSVARNLKKAIGL